MAGGYIRSKQNPEEMLIPADGEQMRWGDRLLVDISLPCDIALAPRPPQTFQGVTELIGRNSAVIVLDPKQPVSEWPRVGDIITANCALPTGGNSRFRAIQCHGTVTRVLLTETGAPRLEVSVDHLKFRGSEEGPRKAKAKKQASGNGKWM